MKLKESLTRPSGRFLHPKYVPGQGEALPSLTWGESSLIPHQSGGTGELGKGRRELSKLPQGSLLEPPNTHILPPHGLKHLLKLHTELLDVVHQDAGLQGWDGGGSAPINTAGTDPHSPSTLPPCTGGHEDRDGTEATLAECQELPPGRD